MSFTTNLMAKNYNTFLRFWSIASHHNIILYITNFDSYRKDVYLCCCVLQLSKIDEYVNE